MENDKNGKRKPVKRNVKRKKVLRKSAPRGMRCLISGGKLVGDRDGPACTVRTGLSVVSVHLYEK